SDMKGENLKFSHLNQGPFVEETIKGVKYAESLNEVLNNNFELRLLKIPALYIVALWLHAEQDILFPLPPTHHVLKPYSTYNEEEFARALSGPAIERLKFYKDLP